MSETQETFAMSGIQETSVIQSDNYLRCNDCYASIVVCKICGEKLGEKSLLFCIKDKRFEIDKRIHICKNCFETRLYKMIDWDL